HVATAIRLRRLPCLTHGAARRLETALDGRGNVAPSGGAARQVSPNATAAIATTTTATVAVSTVTAVATQCITRSRPARNATARGNAAGMAGRVSTGIGQVPISRASIRREFFARDPRGVTNQLARDQNIVCGRHTDKLFARGSRTFAATS